MKNYLAEAIDLKTDSYLNPVPAIFDNGLHNRAISSITSISIHHSAVPRAHNYDSVARYKQEAAEHYKRLGPGLQYHAVVDNVGQIFYTRPFTTWLYCVGSSENVSTLAICLDGYFSAPYNQKPTREQYEALGQLLVNLCEQHPEFPATYKDVRPHRDFSSTNCPGDSFAPWVFAIQSKADVLNIPIDAVYDWPELQPAPTQPPVVVPPPVPAPDLPVLTQDKKFKPAAYVSQVKTHLDGLETGKRYADYEPGVKFDFVARFYKGDLAWLLTPYAITIHEQGKRELAGVPEKDVLLAQVPGSQPTPPSPVDPNQLPPVVVAPPAPSPADQSHEERISALEALVQKIIDFLNSIFKNGVRKE